MAPWRVVGAVADASGTPVRGARLSVSVWSGGQVERRPEVVLAGPAIDVDAPDGALSIVLQLRHARFAPLVLALTRSPGEPTWRWTNPTRSVRTAGAEVHVDATLGRMRPAPTQHLDERDLERRVESVRGRLEENEAKNAAARKRKKPAVHPGFVMLDPEHRTALTTRDQLAYRHAGAFHPRVGRFHLLEREPLGPDPTATGWLRFAAREVPVVDPAAQGRLYLVEYGEVGDDRSAGPRFLVGVWVPLRLHARGVTALDFVVWLHPHTNNPLANPQVRYPFGPPYPYGLIVTRGRSNQPIAAQRFVDIPVAHIGTQHFLAYALLAARRDAVVVVPVAPSSHFEPFESPGTLMRLLRELCLWIPRDDDGGRPAVHPPGPRVGRVVVSGFSASVPRLSTLMHSRVPDSHYTQEVWGTREDVSAFDRVWKEQWALDGVADGFAGYIDAAASWVRTGPDRRIRVYKSDFTGGRWDPLARRPGPWASLVRGAKPVVRSQGKLFGLWCADPQDRWHAVSVSKELVVAPSTGPGSELEPRLDGGSHEMMPRLFFGHAAATSGLTRA